LNVARNKKLFTYKPDHVFDDGIALKTVRDAIIAAGQTGWEMAKRYNLQEAICMKCANPVHSSQGTYLMRSGIAMRFCKKCPTELSRHH
jgi:hypothetical protein